MTDDLTVQPTIALSNPALSSTVAELHRVRDALEERRRSTERQVDVLLDGGWSGAAASAYLEGWTQWRLGCVDVLEALRVMTGLMLEASAELAVADDGARLALTSLTRRLVERLG